MRVFQKHIWILALGFIFTLFSYVDAEVSTFPVLSLKVGDKVTLDWVGSSHAGKLALIQVSVLPSCAQDQVCNRYIKITNIAVLDASLGKYVWNVSANDDVGGSGTLAIVVGSMQIPFNISVQGQVTPSVVTPPLAPIPIPAPAPAPVTSKVSHVNAVDVSFPHSTSSVRNLPPPKSTITNSCSVNLDVNFFVGSRGEKVRILQNYLKNNAYPTGYTAEVTGYFGIQTYRAVLKFQSSNSIEATGFVGPITRAKIMEKSIYNCKATH